MIQNVLQMYNLAGLYNLSEISEKTYNLLKGITAKNTIQMYNFCQTFVSFALRQRKVCVIVQSILSSF